MIHLQSGCLNFSTIQATPLSVTDAGPVKSHILLHDNTSPSSELPEKVSHSHSS